MKRFRPVGVILLAFLNLMAGCTFIGGTQQPTKNYVLNSLHSEKIETQAVADLNDIGILVGPIRMALYLDRSDIVTRGSSNQVEIAEFAQWAGPLPENFSRVLAENLSVLLKTDKVGVFPFVRREELDYNVTVYVTRFDGMPAGIVASNPDELSGIKHSE